MRCSLLSLLFLCSILSFALANPSNLTNDSSLDEFKAAADPNIGFFVSSNTESSIGVFDVDGTTVTMGSSFTSVAGDADGIYYDEENDVLYQLNRTSNVINAYSNVADAIANGTNPDLTATSSSDFSNGREIAFYNGKLVVAQDANPGNGDANRFIIYDASPTSITLDKIYDADINLWGIHANGTTLYAIEDNSSNVAVYLDFFAQPAGAISPSSTVMIENMVRTHGITYDADSDLMLLTDVGDAASSTDGALVAINNFGSASGDGMVSMGEQMRVSGGASKLGNPVDLAYDPATKYIFVAERANEGGRVLGFKFPVLSGAIAPVYNVLFSGASAINLSVIAPTDCDLVEDGGTVSFETGGTERTIFVDGVSDFLSFETDVDTSTGDFDFTYVVTNDSGIILGIPPGNTVDFDGAGLGTCRVYGLPYTGNLNIMMGDDLLVMGLAISDDCFKLSDNYLTVNRIAPEPAAAQFFVSSNTSSTVGVFDVLMDNSVVMTSFPSMAMDADGIFYDETADVLYQLNRTDNVINAYSDVSDSLATGGTPVLTAASSSDFSNGREIAVADNKLVVAQDANAGNGMVNRFYIYTISPTSITLDATLDADINLWGIHADGHTLLAIIDNSNQLAIYNDFFDNMTGPVFADDTVSVDGLVRTHGLTYDAEDDILFLTDVGDAASSTDGALVVVKNFMTASADGTISAAEQIRVSGASSLLGNPVDVAYDKAQNRIYVAERANGGGRVLGYNFPLATGGISPTYNKLFAGASAIHLPGLEVGLCDFVDGGGVTFETGGTETTIIVDGVSDFLSFASDVDAVAAGHLFTYVVTDAAGMILGIPGGNTVDFDGAGIGVCRVYGLSYTGSLNIMMGDDLLAPGLMISDECFDLSDNHLSVNRIAPEPAAAQFFVSSNTSSTVGVFDVLMDNSVVMTSFPSMAMDADGIFYDEAADVLYQLNRTDNVINAYSDVSDSLATGGTPVLTATSSSDFSNGREIAVADNKLVVAQDANAGNGMVNRFYIYTISPTSITLDATLDADINLWGIHADGHTLLAIIDNSNQLAIYNNFFDNMTGPVFANDTVSVDGLVRTHGLTYDAEDDILFLTDVGDAASSTDGALVVVRNFMTASADGTISAAEQIRVSGASSLLGNPVDVAYDKAQNRIYVAERANGGGRVLGYNFPVATGGIAPTYNKLFAGASAIHLPGLEVGLCDFVDGGGVTFETGGTEMTIIVDGVSDFLSFASDVDAVAEGHLFTYVVTDAAGMILGIPGGNTVDFDGAGIGVCRVYGLSYTGSLNIMMGDDLLVPGLMISDECFDLSDNHLSVNRIAPEPVAAQFFASSNTSSTVGVFDVLMDNSVVMSSFPSMAMDADGIFYDEVADVLYQLNRTDNVINAYSDVSDSLATGGTPVLTATSSSDFSNGREIAVANGQLVVAQDANTGNGNTNRFYIYNISPTAITLDKIYDADINLWGIHADGTTLYAVEDNSNRVARYDDFFAQPAGAITPDALISIENLVRTHGLTYDTDQDIMLLTDVGDAASDTDGALVAIRNFTTAAADNLVTASEQARVSGGASKLGNPVDVAYDVDQNRVYVAERANGGGRILGFKFPVLSGGIAPFYNQLFAGASAIHLPHPSVDNFAGEGSSNAPEGTVAIRTNSSLTFDRLYPVPAINEINLEVASMFDQEVVVVLYDMTGVAVKSQEVALVKGANLLTFNIGELTTGYHFITIPATGFSKKFVKVNQ